MDFYLFSLLLGFLGLAGMALGGVMSHGHGGPAHGGHDVGDVSLGGHGHAGHVGHGHAGHVHAGHAHGHDLAHGHDAGHAHGGKDHGPGTKEHGGTRWLLAFLSPRVLFSVFLGLGAVGLAARDLLGGPLLFGAALAGGVAFEKLLVAPMWNFLMRFASRPALTLESALFDTGTAVTGFNAAGEGLIRLEVDGQVVQLLATLRPRDRAAGIRVRAGDPLLVESIDGARNRCVVSPAASAPAALPGG